MSWEDDFCGLEPPYDFSYHEELWKEGKHEDREANEYLIKDMTNSHLINTIVYFESRDADVSPLRKEAEKRGIKIRLCRR